MNECFASVAKLFNVAYYIVTVINNYLLVASNNFKNQEEVADQSENKEESLIRDINEPFLSRYKLGKLNESVVYVVYLVAVLKSFHENFKHVSSLISRFFRLYILRSLGTVNRDEAHSDFDGPQARYYDYITESDLTELESITGEIVKMHPDSPALLLKLAIMKK